VVDQLSRNIYSCISANFAGLPGLPSDYDQYETGELQSPSTNFDDYRIPQPDIFSLILSNSNDYPANYAISLLETLTTIIHYGMIESTSAAIPFLLMQTSFTNSSLSAQQTHYPVYNSSTLSSSKHSDTTSGISLTMGSMFGSAISVIPGSRGASEFVSNMFGKVFTSADSGSHSSVSLSLLNTIAPIVSEPISSVDR
jgi:hypothetical protein